MMSKRMVVLAILVVSLFFISPALACNYPGPEGSSITVTVHTSDGTPIPGACVTLLVYNGSHQVDSIGEQTNDNGQFTWPGPSGPDQYATGLTYKIHASYGSDQVTIECEGSVHTADSATFTLAKGEHKYIDITIPGVTVVHGGSCDDGNPCPSGLPQPSVCPPIAPKGDHVAYPPMAAGKKAGIVMGVILTNETSEPITDAYVAIVNANNHSIEYSAVTTDANGLFEFYNVNSTNGTPVYAIYINDGHGKSVYSNPFALGSSQTVQINLGINQQDVVVEIPLPNSKPVTVSATPETNVTVTPAPTVVPELANAESHNPDLISQITDFIGSIIFGVIHI